MAYTILYRNHQKYNSCKVLNHIERTYLISTNEQSTSMGLQITYNNNRNLSWLKTPETEKWSKVDTRVSSFEIPTS